jgi:2-hydroxychromene-2-carboxylate isomerase
VLVIRRPKPRVATEKADSLAALREKRRKRIWVQQVAVDADMLETRVKVACARGLDPAQQAAADGACEQIRKAWRASSRGSTARARAIGRDGSSREQA